MPSEVEMEPSRLRIMQATGKRTNRVFNVMGFAILATFFTVEMTMAQTQLPFAFPKAGQNQQRQAADSQACQGWAQQQTNFNPQQAELNMLRQQQAQQQQVTQAQQQTQAAAGRRGGLLRGGARGAALGAVGGAIGGNAGTGAKIGAAVGALGGGMRRRSAQKQAQSQSQQMQQQAQQQQAGQQQQFQQQLAGYHRAYGACMQGKNYSVQ